MNQPEFAYRLKVAHICSSDMSLRYLLLNQLKSLQEAGWEVVGISAPGPEIPFVQACGVRCITVPMVRSSFRPLSDLAALWRLYRTLRRERFTIVHTHTPKAGLLGQYAALFARVPVRVHTIHGLYFPGNMNSRFRWVYVLLERITMLFSHMNLSQNAEDIPVAIKEKISPLDRIQLLGNGIDVRAYDPALQPDEKRSATRSQLGLGPEHKIIGMVARFVAEKGYLELLEAVPLIRAVVPQARFILIGPVEPGKKDRLDPSIIGEMGLEDIVLSLGHRTDMADLYAVMDVLVLPSHREGFPRAPMEAASMGVPVVVTDIRGCRQTVAHGETGYLVPLRNPQALASAIVDLLTNDEKRRAFGLAAREKALAEFDERIVFSKIQKTYSQLLRGHKRSTSVAHAMRRW